MGPGSDCRRHPESGREVAVASAAHRLAFDAGKQQLRHREQLGRGRLRHRGPVDGSVDRDLRPVEVRGESRERRFDGLLLVGRLDTDVDDDGRLGGHDVVQGACRRDGRGDGRADAGSSECRDVQHPVRGFNQGVDPGSRLMTRVRRPPRDSDFERATAHAARHQGPLVGCALEDEYSASGEGPFLDESPRGVRGSRRRSSSEQMAGTLQPLVHHRAEQPEDGAGDACRSLDMAYLCHLREVTRPVCSADDSERPVNQV